MSGAPAVIRIENIEPDKAGLGKVLASYRYAIFGQLAGNDGRRLVKNQTDVALELGMSQPVLSQIENGARFPAIDQLQRMIKLYQIDDLHVLWMLRGWTDCDWATDVEFDDRYPF